MPARSVHVADQPPGTDSENETKSEDEEDDNRMPSAALMVILCFTFAVEGIDTALLPAVAFALQKDLSLDLIALGYCSTAQAVAMAGIGPVWGILADRRVFRRKSLMAFGALMQGVITCILAFVDHVPTMVFLRFCNGAMLASLKPLSVGIVADATSENSRGKIYGWLQFFNTIGMMAGTFVATPMSVKTVLGHQGWRSAFGLAGSFAVLTSILIMILMKEVKRQRTWNPETKKQRGCHAASACAEEFGKVAHYFKMPTFICLIAQGVVGSIPWNAFNYMTLYFQGQCLSADSAASLGVVFQGTCAVGNVLGGFIGDALAAKCPYHGRPFTANISVGLGIPCAMFIFFLPPPAESAYWTYFGLLGIMGLTATWCAVGVNWPILGQIVEPRQRSTIMAWEGSFEGATASVAGGMGTTWIAKNIFHYDLSHNKKATCDPKSARALGNALGFTSLFPWLLCLFFYIFLHWSLPRDLRKIEEEKEDYLDQHDGQLVSESSESDSDEGC